MLLDRLQSDLLDATRARDQARKTVLRWLIAQCKNARIEKGADLTDDDVQAVLKRGVKMRADAVEQYRKGGRDDLVASESGEIEIIQTYLPEQKTGAALRALVEAAIEETGATSPRDMGKVMKSVMSAHGGEVDGKEVQAVVRELLGG
ncbi:MAG: GatB/YqeY domain-containing protein [Candidatus Eiseniibacteriota bacterium]|jgi:uncharacterized protein YqeY